MIILPQFNARVLSFHFHFLDYNSKQPHDSKIMERHAQTTDQHACQEIYTGGNKSQSKEKRGSYNYHSTKTEQLKNLKTNDRDLNITIHRLQTENSSAQPQEPRIYIHQTRPNPTLDSDQSQPNNRFIPSICCVVTLVGNLTFNLTRKFPFPPVR